METPILLSPVALETVSIVTEYIVLETQRLHMSVGSHNEKQSSHDLLFFSLKIINIKSVRTLVTSRA